MSSPKDTDVIEMPFQLPQHLDSIPGRGQYTEKARQERLEFIVRHAGVSHKWIANTRLPAEFLHGNLENYIGAVEIPVGIAGPLAIVGNEGSYVVYSPLATTEGALVSSVSRGSRVISSSGGCRVHAISQCMTRAPVFKFHSIDEALQFSNFVGDHFEQLKSVAESASRHATLRSVETDLIGRIVHTRFTYETGDAAGQNMTTKCTDRACAWLLSTLEQKCNLRPLHHQIDGNTSGDKKVTNSSYLRGRGTRVTSEVEISNDILEKIFHLTSERFYDGYQLLVNGAIASGMISHNVNVSNVVAAIFTATGQDIACVHESSLGHLHIEKTERGVYASMTLPTLVIGTIGGGTGLPGQREMLEYLGCDGPGGTTRLAEIICATSLALDLSTLAAVAAGDFASSHARLGARPSGQ